MEFRAFLNKKNTRCKVCGCIVEENHYALAVIVDGKKIIIHDNEGVCLNTLMVSLGLRKPNFKSSIKQSID